MEREAAVSKVTERFHRTVAESSAFHSALLLVHSGSRDVHLSLAAGDVGQDPVDPEQPFYSASIGKTFTATIVAMLVEEGDLRFDDSISRYLSDEVLDGLHVYRGTDYTDDIQIRHLLTHTSGLPHLLGDEYGIFLSRTRIGSGNPTRPSPGRKPTFILTSRPATGCSTRTSATISSA